ncbi:DUF1361 domain-containing protein [uncultured Nonlabens sp.]|uniref:DUF1361 domain-containing protein n=1 Tax=uncultured Nonlabens sp. TaxID=859306 RepID=UPI002636D11F|nr:DUF1361 domain-containing protein [uncultured Nonlabens sp.]
MKEFIAHRFTEFKQVSLLTLLSLFLLALRMKITHDFFLLFLIWNLFLAFIPYLMVVRLRFRESVSTANIILTGIVWLAFLPNAPYIITDLIHVRHASSEWMVYEALMLASFAITGLYLGLLSLRDMSTVLQQKGWITSSKYRSLFEYTVLALCGYGIYLGRVLRWNSWDIIQQPEKLFYDMRYLFIHPFSNQKAWLLIISMSLFLIVIFSLFKNNTIVTKTAP